MSKILRRVKRYRKHRNRAPRRGTLREAYA
jgi:hypothetical protein